MDLQERGAGLYDPETGRVVAHLGTAATCQELANGAVGHVLEVGVGLGVTHKALHENPRVGRIDPVDPSHTALRRGLRACRCCGIWVRHDELPAAWRTGQYDTVVWDVFPWDGTRASIQQWALPFLREGGRLHIGELQDGRHVVSFWVKTDGRFEAAGDPD